MLNPNQLQVGNSTFAFLLYQKIAKNSSDNVFISPYSISSILAMVMLGSRGDTLQEIKNSLQLTEISDKEIQSGLLETLESLSDQTDVTLEIANKLFADTRFQINEDFIQKCMGSFKSTLEQLDFYEKPEVSRSYINTWVQKQTADKIKDLLPSGSITNDSRLVLTNAMYFKGNWLDKFQDKETTDMKFHKSENETVTIPMMIQKRKYKTIMDMDLKAQVVELPYQGEELAMFVIVPTDQFGLSELEKNLTAEKVVSLISNATEQEIILGLPKMKLEHNVELIPILKEMGINCMFDRAKANFQGISNAENLFVSGIFHKAFIEVNEEGSEAAAATSLVMMPMCALLPPPTIMCDHPFMFIIYHKPSQLTLFIGRFTTP